jgi:hypothetical protein
VEATDAILVTVAQAAARTTRMVRDAAPTRRLRPDGFVFSVAHC